MPIYEFECRECRKGFESYCKFSETSSVICPQCGGGTRKLISAPNLRLEEKPFYSYALGKRVGGNKEWIAKAKKRGWDTEILDPY